MNFADEKFLSLPCADLIRQGASDLQEGRISVGACLVAIALPRMKKLGIIPQDFETTLTEGEITLYRILCEQKSGDPYSRYNALKRELTSFLHCASL